MTAMAYRQVGIFKVAGRDVYEDLETGDFWKISEDKKHVMRLFKEDEKGVADKKASKEVEAKEFADSSEFTTAFEKAEKHVDELKRAIDTEKWLTYLKEGDKTEYVTLFEKFMAGIDSFFELSKSMGFKITSTLEADVKLEGNSVKELLKKIKDNDQINDALDKDEDDIDEEYEGEYYVHLVLKTKENYTKEKLEEEIKDLHYDEDEFNLTHTFYDFEGIQKFRKIPDGYEFVVSWVTAK
ncbi:MAG: hypothetical protein PHF86_13375, partial [Candidatus Nanoarchaeia archaeon]|nr:hypothetical protein [Candidatus Nanoarchaeia archaeon]